MTESDRNGRLDLRPLTPSDAQSDRVIRSVMARIHGTPQLPADTLTDLTRRFMRPALVSAAVLAAAAAYAIVMIEPRGIPEQPVAVLAEWVESQHVPTNSELLVAFQGYAR